MIFLETKRLIIKLTSLDNLENIYSLYSDPEVMRYLGHGVKSLEETEAAVKILILHYEKHGFSSGDVYEKETGLYIGRAGLGYLELNDKQPDVEIGYILHKQFWNKGYATELARATLAWGFKNLNIQKLVGSVAIENTGSRRVLEKVGMTYIGDAPYNGLGAIHYWDGVVAKYEVSSSVFNDLHKHA